MLWSMWELAPSPLLMIGDMLLVVAPDAWVGLVGHVSLGRAEGDCWVTHSLLCMLGKSSKADGEERGGGCEATALVLFPGHRNANYFCVFYPSGYFGTVKVIQYLFKLYKTAF